MTALWDKAKGSVENQESLSHHIDVEFFAVDTIFLSFFFTLTAIRGHSSLVFQYLVLHFRYFHTELLEGSGASYDLLYICFFLHYTFFGRCNLYSGKYGPENTVTVQQLLTLNSTANFESTFVGMNMCLILNSF